MENALINGEVRGEDPREIVDTQFVVPTEHGPAPYRALGLVGVLRPVIVIRQSGHRCARFPVVAEFARQDLQVEAPVDLVIWFLQRYATPDAPPAFPFARMVFNGEGRMVSCHDYIETPGLIQQWYHPLSS